MNLRIEHGADAHPETSKQSIRRFKTNKACQSSLLLRAEITKGRCRDSVRVFGNSKEEKSRSSEGHDPRPRRNVSAIEMNFGVGSSVNIQRADSKVSRYRGTERGKLG